MKSWLLGAACAALVFVSGCGSQSGDSSGNGLTIVVIPKGTTHEFWKSIHAGALKARQELKAAGQPVEIIWKGPLKEDDRDEQIKVVENFIARGVDGMVLAPLDDKALVRPVETSGNADIPVVIIDSGLQTDKYTSFVATDNHLGGRMGGAHLGKLLGGKGNVLLLRYAVGSASTTKREQGFLDEMKENFPGIEVLSSDQYAGATRDLAYTASQNLLSRYGNEVNGIFCPNESVTVSMTKAVRDIGKAGGMVKIIGFDTSVQSLRDLKSGDVAGARRAKPGQDGLPRRDDIGRASRWQGGGQAHRHRRGAYHQRKHERARHAGTPQPAPGEIPRHRQLIADAASTAN